MPKRGAAKKAARKATTKGPKRTTAIRPDAKGKDAEVLKGLDAKQGVTGGMWKGEVEGDTIIGEVLVLKREDTQYQDNQLVAIIGTAEGAKTVYCNWSMEQALLAEVVDVGDRVGIQFKGTVPAGRGRPMRVYAAVRVGGKGKKANAVLTAGTGSSRKKGRKRR